MHDTLVYRQQLQLTDSSNSKISEIVVFENVLFRSDTQAEIDLVKRIAIENGAFDAVMADHWAKGRSQ